MRINISQSKNNRCLYQGILHLWSKFGYFSVNFLSQIWPWRWRLITTQNDRNLNQCIFHLWLKFGDSIVNGWWVIVQTSSWLTDRQTDTETQATTIPKGQNWPLVKAGLYTGIYSFPSKKTKCLNAVTGFMDKIQNILCPTHKRYNWPTYMYIYIYIYICLLYVSE